MGAFLGLLAGVGALLIWQGLTPRAHGPRRHPRADRVREELAQAGLSGVTPNQLIAVQVGVSVLVLVIGIVVTGSLSVSIVFGLFASVGPRLLVARLRRRRQSDLRDLWPEVVDNLISGVRAGLSLPEALSSLGTRGPEPLREPFRHFGSDYRTTGKFGDCLDRLKTALADPVGDRVCESLRVAREVGGTDLGRLLATLSAFLREDARTRAELLARQSWSVKADHRNEGIDRPDATIDCRKSLGDETGCEPINRPNSQPVHQASFPSARLLRRLGVTALVAPPAVVVARTILGAAPGGRHLRYFLLGHDRTSFL